MPDKFHSKEVYYIFPYNYHEDTEYGLNKLLPGFRCEIKFDIDSDINEIESYHHPEIRLFLREISEHPGITLKYKMNCHYWKNGLTKDTKDDFMGKVILDLADRMKRIQNNLIHAPEEEFIEIV